MLKAASRNKERKEAMVRNQRDIPIRLRKRLQLPPDSFGALDRILRGAVPWHGIPRAIEVRVFGLDLQFRQSVVAALRFSHLGPDLDGYFGVSGALAVIEPLKVARAV